MRANRLLGLATIKDISGDKFKAVLADLARQGWRQGSRYSGFDAGILAMPVRRHVNGVLH